MRYIRILGVSFFFVLYFCARMAWAQAPQVPKTMDFAGMKLHLTDQARQDIQSSVDALYRSERHFNIMLERVDLYLPLIEPIFEEYGIPPEFKYLVIQESALVSDAISSSNAVGFWQFKEASATELDMRIDRQVDERMNIISSTQGAARYLLRSNAEFDNWLYSLQSYMVGQGGTSRTVNKKHYGAREMKVDEDTHWYVKKFLSYKVAFEPVVGKQSRNLILYEYKLTANKSLRHIAQEFDTDEEQLVFYNKWLKTSRIPDDKNYSVIIPLNIDNSQDLLADYENEKKKKVNEAFGIKERAPGNIPQSPSDKLVVIEFNDLKAIVAREGDNHEKLADAGGISEKRFRRFNDLETRDKIVPGQIYYLERKHTKARVYEHVFQPGESLWGVSQHYGLRLNKLLQKNRLKAAGDPVKPGQVLWLRFIRPRNEAVAYREIKAPRETLYASTKKKLLSSTAQPPSAPAADQTVQTEENLRNESTQKKIEGQLTDKEHSPTSGSSEAVYGLRKKQEPIAKLGPEQPVIEQVGSQDVVNSSDGNASTEPAHQRALYPPDTTSMKGSKTYADADKVKVVQKDTAFAQAAQGKIPSESEENPELIEEWGHEGPVFDEPAPGTSAVTSDKSIGTDPRRSQGEITAQIPSNTEVQPELSPNTEQFTVDEPVKFVGEKSVEKAPGPVTTEQFHQVKAGETLYSLSQRYKTTVQDLIKWNNLPAKPIINVGQQLKVAAPASLVQPADLPSEPTPEVISEQSEEPALTPELKYHVVSAGESMYRVARLYDVTIKDIMKWNNKENFDLKEGEKLIVGKSME